MYSSVDVFISTLVPVSFVLALDLLVLCFRPTRQQSDPLLQVVFHKLDEDTEKVFLLTLFLKTRKFSEKTTDNTQIYVGNISRDRLFGNAWNSPSHSSLLGWKCRVHLISNLQGIIFGKSEFSSFFSWLHT